MSFSSQFSQLVAVLEQICSLERFFIIVHYEKTCIGMNLFQNGMNPFHNGMNSFQSGMKSFCMDAGIWGNKKRQKLKKD